jgi:acetylornithine/succinyldiaminopimelate/putrescine aminotransferase
MLLNNTGKNMLLLKGASGTQLTIGTDSTTRVVTDMISGIWHIGFGHNEIEIKQDLSIFTAKYTHTEKERLGDRIAEAFQMPGVMLFNTGSETTDAAIRVLLTLSKRTKVLSLEKGYHGSTGFAALVGRDLNRISLPSQMQNLFDGGAIGDWAFEREISQTLIDTELDKICWSELLAFIFEPIQGSAGGRMLHPAVYNSIAQRCVNNGVYIIADEIMTGMGRCGYFALSQTYPVRPNIILLGKMLGNGQPISAVLLDEGLCAHSDRIKRRGYYGTTTGGNLLACQTALAVFDRLTPSFLEEVRDKSEYLQTIFHKTFAPQLFATKFTAPHSQGLFFGSIFANEADALEIHRKLLDDHAISADVSGHKLRFVPALTMPREQIKDVFTASAKVLRALKTEK